MNKIKTRAGFEIIFIGTIIFSFLLWLIFIFAGGPGNSQVSVFFRQCEDFLADCSNVTGYSAGLNPYNNTVFGLEEKAYPPLSYVCMYCLSRMTCVEDYAGYIDLFTDPRYMIMVILGLMLISVLLFIIVRTVKSGNEVTKNLMGLAVIVSAPVLYSYERGNTIVITAALCLYYIFYYNHENKVLRELAYMALAVAVAFKMTPAILGILLLYDKQWKAAVRTVIYGIVAVFLPFVFLQGGFTNIPLMFRNIYLNIDAYASTSGCTFAAFITHYASIFNENYVMTDVMIKVIQNISYIVAAFLLISAPLCKKNWQKIASVVIVLVMVPSHSGYYCLLYLIPVTIMFLNEYEHSNIDFVYLVCFLIISWVYVCSIQNYIHYSLALAVLAVMLVINSIFQLTGFIKQRLQAK